MGIVHPEVQQVGYVHPEVQQVGICTPGYGRGGHSTPGYGRGGHSTPGIYHPGSTPLGIPYLLCSPGYTLRIHLAPHGAGAASVCVRVRDNEALGSNLRIIREMRRIELSLFPKV